MRAVPVGAPTGIVVPVREFVTALLGAPTGIVVPVREFVTALRQFWK